MLSAIQLSNQERIRTDEVDDVAIDLVLPTEFPSTEMPIAQLAPKQMLGVGHALAQSPRTSYMQAFHPEDATPSICSFSPPGRRLG
jgi:hypothetical protein